MTTSRRLARAGHARVLAAMLSLALTMLVGSANAAALPTGTPALPDGRGYEKVSSNDNADGNVYQAWTTFTAANDSSEGGWTELPFEASPSGDAVAYTGSPSSEGGVGLEGANAGNQYLARRTSDGRWESANITPSSDEFFTVPQYQGFSSDLAEGLLVTNPASPLVSGAPAEHFKIPYMQNFATGTYTSLMKSVPPNREYWGFGAYETTTGSRRLQPVFAGSSTDLSHVLFMANDALTENAIDGGEEANNLYDYSGGMLSLVNVLPNGQPEPSAVFGGPVIPPVTREENSPGFSHVISENGSRIFWTGQGANQNLYMREDGSSTIQVDAAVGGKGQYWTATPDGSKVLFTKNGDLYEYSVANEQVSDLVPGGEVQGIVGTSEDLSYVYFVANGALAAGAEQGTCKGSEGTGEECALYVLHKGSPVRFIGMLSGADNWSYPNSDEARDGDWQASLANNEAEVTPDGLHLLFGSVRPLTGYHNNSDEELFLYDYQAERLSCISCNPSGASPAWVFSAYLPVSHQASYSLHPMASDGDRVFFDSFDPLVAQDANGVNDVYEWEREGSGGCGQAGGCIYLITGGTAEEGSYLVDASATGDDVFFTTREQLASEDQNENVDLYDAHVGGISAPAAPQCAGTGCQGVPSAPPVFATPPSVTFNGVGNFAAPKKSSAKSKKASPKHTVKKKKKKTKKKSKKGKKAGVRRMTKRLGKAKQGRGK